MTLSATAPLELSGRTRDAGIALLAALAVLALSAVTGFKPLSDAAGDNDSLLRLVEVRDLLAGQGWFDLHQYRLGPDGGVLMHWSRLVDAPIAAIILVVRALTGSQATGETVAMVVWPLALYAVALFQILRLARRLGGEEVALPAALIGATTLHYVGIFIPGALDHHNVQLVLMLATVQYLLDAAPQNKSAWWAGVFAVLMLAVGMETAPYVAVAGIFVAAWFLIEGEEASGIAGGFGAAFAVSSAVAFFGFVPAVEWMAVHCDAFSVAHLAIGALGGAGLALIAATPALKGTFSRRAVSMAVLGGVAAVVAIKFFPQCLDDPYAGLGPVLRSFWLDYVAEAQPLWRVVAKEPQTAAAHYVTPLIALIILALRLRRDGYRREELLIAAFLLTAYAVSIWQLRGSRFSVPLACVPLAVWVAEQRLRSAARPGNASSLKLVGAWLISFNICWIMAALGAWYVFAPAGKVEAMADAGHCQADVDYAELAGLPAQGVLVISNLGAPVLRYTPHHVLAGPYHRNIEGNTAAIEALTGTPAEAEAIVRRHGMTLVAVCRNEGESDFLTERAPNGMLAGLLAGKVPGWLDIIPESAGKPLELYRVKPHG